MRPLSILVCLTYYLPHRTGLTLHAARLARELAARGHLVTVLSARFRRDLASDETIAGVRVVRLAAPLRLSRGVLAPAYPRALGRLLCGADVVHVHSPLPEAALVAWRARRAGVPLVITHHGDVVLPRGPANRAAELAMRASFAAAARRAAALVAYSDDYAAHSEWLRPHAAKTTAILPPIEIPLPAPERVAALRRRLGVAGRRLIGFAGRFVEEKRPDVLLRALPAVAREHPTATAVFAGQRQVGYERFYDRHRELVAASGDRVRFAGLIDDPEELAAFYAACDVLALPSQTECFGLVQAEAMLCGTPVVASDIPGARVPVRLTGMGRLVPPRDPAALAAALADILCAPERCRRPRAEIAAVFSLARTVDACEAVLEDAAAQGHRAA
jgi:glycosyltransferase involved in cell wall biosynthesis